MLNYKKKKFRDLKKAEILTTNNQEKKDDVKKNKKEQLTIKSIDKSMNILEEIMDESKREMKK